MQAASNMGDDATSGQPPAGSSSGIFRRIKDIFSKVNVATILKTKTGLIVFLIDNKITLKNLLLATVVLGLQRLLSSEVFECPLNYHKAYGTSFLVAPFVIVFFTNLVILGELSKITDRCCVERYRRWGVGSRVVPDTIKACFGPFIWLIASFADTTYYVCSEVGQPIEKRNLTNETVIKALEQQFADAKSTSQMLAWLLFSILVMVTAIVMISKRCILKDTDLLEDPFILERREALQAMETFRQRTRDLYKLDDLKERNSGHTSSVSEGASRSVDSVEGPVPGPADPNVVTSEPGAGDHDKDRKEDDKEETDPFLPKDEKITLYPHGAPELFGKRRVEKLFENWSKRDKWHYLEAYETFARMYPRITSGKPWDPWVSKSMEKDKKKTKKKKKATSSP